jgi:uncharacterized protein (DUF58 family)
MKKIYGWILLVLIALATASILSVMLSPDIARDPMMRWYYAVLTILGIFFMVVAAHFTLESQRVEIKAKSRRR